MVEVWGIEPQSVARSYVDVLFTPVGQGLRAFAEVTACLVILEVEPRAAFLA